MKIDKAIACAKYLIKRTGKRCFIFNDHGHWSFTECSEKEVQSKLEYRISEYQEIYE